MLVLKIIYAFQFTTLQYDIKTRRYIPQYRCESGIDIFAWRVTWNLAYSPFSKINLFNLPLIEYKKLYILEVNLLKPTSNGVQETVYTRSKLVKPTSNGVQETVFTRKKTKNEEFNIFLNPICSKKSYNETKNIFKKIWKLFCLPGCFD